MLMGSRDLVTSATCNTAGSSLQPGSSRETFIAMMKSANLWKGDNLALARRLSRARLRAILAERQMSSGSMVIVEVGGKNPPQVPLIEDDDLVQALAPDRTDDPFDVRILPGGSGSRHDLLDAHGGYRGPEGGAVNAVSVPDKVPMP